MADKNELVKEEISDIYLSFSDELQKAYKGNDRLSSASSDMNYAIELHRKRLKKNGLGINYSLSYRERMVDPRVGIKPRLVYGDNKFRGIVEFHSYKMKYSLCRNKRKLLSKKLNINLFEHIFDIKDDYIPYDDEMICPNCGAVGTIKSLIDSGCLYCGTRYLARDLYPKTMNYYYFPDVSMSASETKKSLIPKMIIGAAIGIFYAAYLFSMSAKDAQAGMEFFTWIIQYVIYGSIAGFLLEVILLLLKTLVLGRDSKGIPLKVRKSKRIFDDKIKRLNQNIEYTYFTGKVITLMRHLMFSDNLDQTPVYEGDDLRGRFDNLVDARYRGALGIEEVKLMDGYIEVITNLYMQNTYYEHGKVRVENEVLKVIFAKKADQPIDFNFSMKRIHCPNCGASFDATRHRYCEYCNSDLHLADVDWSIKKVVV